MLAEEWILFLLSEWKPGTRTNERQRFKSGINANEN
jgi:hypothetical protein